MKSGALVKTYRRVQLTAVVCQAIDFLILARGIEEISPAFQSVIGIEGIAFEFRDLIGAEAEGFDEAAFRGVEEIQITAQGSQIFVFCSRRNQDATLCQ